MLPIAIAIVEQDGQVLIGRRAEGVVLAGLWEFPGGKILADESPADAAVRECREEAGLDVEIVSLDSTVEHHYEQPNQPPLAVRLHFYRCRLLANAQTPLAPFRWVALGDLGDYELPAANRSVIEALMRQAQETIAR
jgi:mutator protein MutT